MRTRGEGQELRSEGELAPTGEVAMAPRGDDVALEGRLVDAEPPPPTGLAATRLSDVHEALGRYEPALFAAIALLVAAVVLPGPALRSADRFFSAPTASPSSGGLDAGTTAPTTIGDGGFAVTGGTLAVPPPLERAQSEPAHDATASANAGPPPTASGPRSPAPPAPTEVAPTHTVVSHGWATANAATLGPVGVPEGGLPVGRRLSEDDKLSFVRLGASSTRLVLRLHGDPGTQRFADSAVVQACRVLVGGWEAKAGMSMAEAPPHDRTSCSPGVAAEDGTWTFDLTRFDDRTDQRGFALVPGPDAPADFQITFDAVVA